MNQATKTRFRNTLSIHNIHNFQNYSGNYKAGFVCSHLDDEKQRDFHVMVRASETYTQAIKRTIGAKI